MIRIYENTAHDGADKQARRQHLQNGAGLDRDPPRFVLLRQILYF